MYFLQSQLRFISNSRDREKPCWEVAASDNSTNVLEFRNREKNQFSMPTGYNPVSTRKYLVCIGCTCAMSVVHRKPFTAFQLAVLLGGKGNARLQWAIFKPCTSYKKRQLVTLPRGHQCYLVFKKPVFVFDFGGPTIHTAQWDRIKVLQRQSKEAVWMFGAIVTNLQSNLCG